MPQEHPCDVRLYRKRSLVTFFENYTMSIAVYATLLLNSCMVQVDLDWHTCPTMGNFQLTIICGGTCCPMFLEYQVTNYFFLKS